MKKIVFPIMLFCATSLFAQQSSVSFITSYAEDAGRLKIFNGVHGGPLAINNFDPDLSSHYQAAGINLVRFPYGDGFEDGFKIEKEDGKHITRNLSKLTLGDIFPDANADPALESSYNFSDFDKYIQTIKKSGAEPVWQAIFDIGKNSNAWLDNGRQIGKSPLDIIRWNNVILNVLRHANNAWAKGGRWNLKYIEFMYDPAGIGGYDFRFEDRAIRAEKIQDPKPGRMQFINDYIECIRTVEKYNSTYNAKVKVLGPGLDAEQTIRYLPEIMNRLGALKINPNSFIFTYRDFNSPQKIYENAVFIRNEIDRMVLGVYKDVPLWNVEWNWSQLQTIPPAFSNNANLNEVSAWIMSHNIQVKSLVQPYWEEAIVYRATRSAINQAKQQPEGSYYFNLNENGSPLPAYIGWQAMNKIAKETPLRLNIRGMSKDSPITILGAKSRDNRKLHLLVCYWRESGEGVQTSLRYSIDISNFSPKEGYRGKLYIIDKNSKTLESKKNIVGSRGREGGLLINEDISLWSAHLIEFER